MTDQNGCNFKVLLFFMYLLTVSVFCQEMFYDRRYDYYDIDTLIQNPRLLKKYLECFLEKGPCPPIGRVFRRKYSFKFYVICNLRNRKCNFLWILSICNSLCFIRTCTKWCYMLHVLR